MQREEIVKEETCNFREMIWRKEKDRIIILVNEQVRKTAISKKRTKFYVKVRKFES